MNEHNPPIIVKRCPVCDKEFIPAPYHTYKIGRSKRPRYVCSYSCLRKYQLEKEAKK